MSLRRHTQRSAGFRFKKSLGQNFLIEKWPCQKIVAILEQAKVQHVLEVGPGHGALTQHILDKNIRVTAVEKDQRCVNRLQDSFGDNPLFSVQEADVVDFDLHAWVQSSGSERLAICGNIPYNMSSSILHWILPEISNLCLVNFMVQLEFAERLAARPASKAYGSLSVFVQLQSHVRFDFKVDRSAFFPVPGVDSAVVTLVTDPDPYPKSVIRQVEKITRKVFSQRRKQLGNSLGNLVSEQDKKSLGLDLTRRCETLSPREFVDLAAVLSK
ncbi:MAG: 16S rRNA (adenine(1518)-N(6)/adenine(1519)-N(6))-dimethyltransferase RsmA [Zetaproteobacteria bacterium]|nr:16S rRNA (adenine(1518)-N(6)/adenine(1519)-N(6))-dimethyltransferase RsmA [Zetaproteobacteria bacterium]